MLIALLAAAPGASQRPTAVRASVTQMTVTEQVIIRVPARGSRRTPLPAPQLYREKKGPHCIDATQIAGAAIIATDAVDMILKGGQRVRAKLEDECPALDYYGGFYVTPAADGQICAGRDSINTRSGGDCQIDRFRKLVAVSAH